MKRKAIKTIFALIGIVITTGCAAKQPTLTGAGSSTPVVALENWESALKSKGVSYNYQSIGKYKAVTLFNEREADFILSTEAISPNHIHSRRNDYIEIPILKSDIAIAYNHNGCDLNLSKEQIHNIYNGVIDNYKQLGCPDQKINALEREEGSGTREAFEKFVETTQMSHKNISPSRKPLQSNNIENILNRIEGGLGYLPSVIISFDNIKKASIIDTAGKPSFPKQSPNRKGKETNTQTNINEHKEVNYPLRSTVYLYIHRQGNKQKATSLKALAEFITSKSGRKIAEEAGYEKAPRLKPETEDKIINIS